MAVNRFSDSNSSWAITDRKEIIAQGKEVLIRMQDRDPFAQFQGASLENIVRVVPEGNKDATSCTIFIASDLEGDGIEGNQMLQEGEDDLVHLPYSFRGRLLGNSHMSPVDVYRNRSSAKNWSQSKKTSLIKWMAKKTISEKFYTIVDDPTNIVIIKKDGTIGGSVSDLSKGAMFGVDHLVEFEKRATDGWTDLSDTEHPSLETYFVEESTEKGMKQVGEFYPVFLLPNSYQSLRKDPRWISEQEQHSHAGLQSAVKGYGGRYGKMIIIEVRRGTARNAGGIRSDSPDFKSKSYSYTGMDKFNAGDGTVTELNFILGTGAIALAFDEEPRYGEDDTVDSGRFVKAWTDQFFGVKKVRFKGETEEEKASIYHDKDYAVIVAPATIY